MTKVLIVDDHEFVRDSLRELFTRNEGFEVVGSLASAAFAAGYCEKLRPDLAILDVCTEGGASGLDAAAEIKARCPEIKIIIISGFDEVTYAPRAKQIGAEGFVHKHKSMDSFMEAVKAVLCGERCFPEPKTIPMPQGEAPLTARASSGTTPPRGSPYPSIRRRPTGRYHKTNMLAKTGFAKAVDLVFHMISNGWINPLG